jgi:hypothetical protein
MLPLRVTSVLLALAAPLLADRLDPALVDARARVLVHLDVQALKATELYRLLRSDVGEKMDEALEDFEAETGLNPLQDLRGVTIYATDVSQDRWIALLHTTARIDGALQELRKQPGYSESRVGDKTIHSFANDHERWFGHLFVGQGGEERLFALAEDSGALVEAIGVVDGARPGLDDAGEPFVASQPGQGAVLFVSAATDLRELADFDPSAELSRLVRGVLFECGESQGRFYSSLRLTTGTPDDALKIQQVIDGGLALASLVLTRTEETSGLKELLSALDVQRTGTVVTLGFRYSAQELYDGLRAFALENGMEGLERR